MNSPERDPEARPRPTGGGGIGDYAGRKGQLPTWPRVALLAVLFGFTFFVVKSCQDDQIRLTQDDAIALAKEQVEFEPKTTQIRLLRQGLDRRPIWVVSLSIPAKGDEGPNPDVFRELALVRIDANKGTVESVEVQGLKEEKAAGPAKEGEVGAANEDSTGETQP